VNLTGTIDWVDIATFGSGGVINVNGKVNVSGLSYAGANADLQALAASLTATDVVTFQFAPATSLTDLIRSGGLASYSGTLSSTTRYSDVSPVPDMGATVTLLGLGFLSLSALAGRKSTD
jgi:hypothetical protein